MGRDTWRCILQGPIAAASDLPSIILRMISHHAGALSAGSNKFIILRLPPPTVFCIVVGELRWKHLPALHDRLARVEGHMPSSEPAWHKASFYVSGECFEVAQRDDMIVLRDSKNPRGRVLRCTTEEWRIFLRSVKDGEFDYLTGPQQANKSIAQRSESVRDDSAPKNWLDLADRVHYRATCTWRKFLMHLALLAASFGGLGLVAHAAASVSPWVTAVSSLGGGAAAGGAAYARRQAVKQVKNIEAQLACRELTCVTVEDHEPRTSQ